MKAGFERTGREAAAPEAGTCIIQTEGLVIGRLEKKKEKPGVTPQQPPGQDGPYELHSHVLSRTTQMMDRDLSPLTRFAWRLLLKAH